MPSRFPDGGFNKGLSCIKCFLLRRIDVSLLEESQTSSLQAAVEASTE
jgi:hypothetical protein